ncbi:hypothetical protein BDK92_7163 [Micromonospora pisi]|uniref:Uncharacterized protein n=1 Tax=Micromonospora pisi TaxID=589240 RepID=A0A495JVW8_9ACTN|nr:hypothetical protein [Micromonospora pisi]RKR92685.1 hypothetical protein BDK92_7163 [Micromonospora pisi]
MSSTTSTTSRRIFGALTITAQITIDGGYTINVLTGPIREHELFFSTKDRDLYRRVYAVIREGGRKGVTPAGIHAAVVDALTDDLHAARRNRDGRRIELLNQALDRLETQAQRKANQELIGGIRANMQAAAAGNPRVDEPNALETLAAQGTRSVTPPTRGGAEYTPASDPGMKVIRAAKANGGTIARGQSASITQLHALERRGLMTLTRRPGTAIVTSGTLTGPGWQTPVGA